MVCPPAAWGTHLVHFTGSKEHNVALRGMALDRGLSLSEKGFKVVEIRRAAAGSTPRRRSTRGWTCRGSRRRCARTLTSSRSPARAPCPTSITVADLKGDTHVHSDWTDGVDSIEVMARASRDRGREWMVLTDHSPSLGVARGLTLERIVEQRAEIDRLNAELAPFRILHGTEMEIRADGSLDYPDELLAVFDLVVASVHTSRTQPSEQLTARTLAAIENPHVDVIAHPTGRIVNRRDPMPLDWPRLFAAAARTGTLLEMNGSPRLDLDDALGRAAAQAGVRLTLASDAHRTEELDQHRVRRVHGAASVADRCSDGCVREVWTDAAARSKTAAAHRGSQAPVARSPSRSCRMRNGASSALSRSISALCSTMRSSVSPRATPNEGE